jgi:hypothetical protein
MTEEVMKTISLEVVREKMLHHIHQVIPLHFEYATWFSLIQMEYVCQLMTATGTLQ